MDDSTKEILLKNGHFKKAKDKTLRKESKGENASA